VPGYAIAYTPKDGPSTPAVVIAPEAEGTPARRKPAALTVPSQARSAPVATPIAASIAEQSSELDELDGYTKKKSKGPIVLAALGAALLLLAIGGIRALSRGNTSSDTSATTATAPPMAPTVAATPAVTQTVPIADPSPAPPASVTTETNTPTSEPAATTEAASKTSAHHGKVVRATPTLPATKAAPHEPAAVSLPAEPNAAPAVSPKASPSKGVIVRDSPF
jgi:hypothetical protein